MVKERISLRQLYGEVAGLPIENIQIEVERDGKNLVLDRAAIEALYAMDTTGRLHAAVDSSGRFTEASAASTLSYLTVTELAIEALNPTFGLATAASTQNTNAKHRIALVLLTSDGAGAVAATTFVPALAGYTGHAKLIGIWSHATDASTTWTISVAGGTLLGPNSFVVAHTAFSVTQFGAVAANQVGCPVYVRGTSAAGADDNKDLQITGSGFAATETAYLIAEYWYET